MARTGTEGAVRKFGADDVPRKDVGVDRWHYDIMVNSVLTEGEHELRFTLGSTAQEGLLQLCSFEIIEYGSDSE